MSAFPNVTAALLKALSGQALAVELAVLNTAERELSGASTQVSAATGCHCHHAAENGQKCFYRGCQSTTVVRECKCGDHPYGPEQRKYGAWMCTKHSTQHGNCANWGHW
ncbi:MAG TPA: hypothetical protein V6D22_21175 [Candidatus Obscuribacterales bacterium]